MDFESLSNLLKQFQKEESIGNLFQKITQKDFENANMITLSREPLPRGFNTFKYFLNN